MKQMASQFFDDEEYDILINAKGNKTWKEFMLTHQDYLKLVKVEK